MLDFSGYCSLFLKKGDFNLKNNLTLLTHQDLATFILQGGYPEVQDKSPRAKNIWYKSYVEGRLFKDFEVLYHARGNYRSKLESLVPYLAGIDKYKNEVDIVLERDNHLKCGLPYFWYLAQ